MINPTPHNYRDLFRPESPTTGPVQEAPTSIGSRVRIITFCYGYLATAFNNTPKPEAAPAKEIYPTNSAYAAAQIAAASVAPAQPSTPDTRTWSDQELAELRRSVDTLASQPAGPIDMSADYSTAIGVPTGSEAVDKAPNADFSTYLAQTGVQTDERRAA